MPIENDDLSLETMLRAAKLREPSERLDARVDQVFANYRAYGQRPFALHRIGWHRIGFHRLAISAGILLAIGIGVRLSLPKPPPTVAIETAEAFKTAAVESHPIQFETDTSTVIDDGVIASEDGVYQQYRRRTVREIWYEDPTTHAKLQVTIPTEQVVIRKVEA